MSTSLGLIKLLQVMINIHEHLIVTQLGMERGVRVLKRK
jgi:hypothetical protein